MTYAPPDPAYRTDGPLPWGVTPDGELTRQGTIVGALMGTLAVFLTFPLGIAGIVLSCMGLDRVQRNPRLARRLVTWSWVMFVPGTLLGLWLVPTMLVDLFS